MKNFRITTGVGGSSSREQAGVMTIRGQRRGKSACPADRAAPYLASAFVRSILVIYLAFFRLAGLI